MKHLFDNVSFKTSKLVTSSYSTSFTLGIKLLDKQIQNAIYGIYGFVRLADEIVDSFHEYPKEDLLNAFERDTYQAIKNGISLNPVLNSFQHTVKDYNISHDLIDSFLKSMKMDLKAVTYDQDKFEEYIYGSAEVVGLMCLKVFTNGSESLYEDLKYEAKMLGSAFQKINFLRDMNADFYGLGRLYFPNIIINEFNQESKDLIEKEIKKEFDIALSGIKKLPRNARFGVYIAYIYYYSLFKKIQRTEPARVLNERIRISNSGKYALLARAYMQHKLGLI